MMKNIMKSRIMINKIIGNNNLKKILLCVFIVIVILLIVNSSLFKKNIENMNNQENEAAMTDFSNNQQNTQIDTNSSNREEGIEKAIENVKNYQKIGNEETQHSINQEKQIEKLQNIPVGIETIENMKIMKAKDFLNSGKRQNGSVYKTENLKNDTDSDNVNDLKKDLKKENFNNLVGGLTTRNGKGIEGNTKNLNGKAESNKSVIEAKEDNNMEKNIEKKTQNFLKNKVN